MESTKSISSIEFNRRAAEIARDAGIITPKLLNPEQIKEWLHKTNPTAEIVKCSRCGFVGVLDNARTVHNVALDKWGMWFTMRYCTNKEAS